MSSHYSGTRFEALSRAAPAASAESFRAPPTAPGSESFGKVPSQLTEIIGLLRGIAVPNYPAPAISARAPILARRAVAPSFPPVRAPSAAAPVPAPQTAPAAKPSVAAAPEPDGFADLMDIYLGTGPAAHAGPSPAIAARLPPPVRPLAAQRGPAPPPQGFSTRPSTPMRIAGAIPETLAGSRLPFAPAANVKAGAWRDERVPIVADFSSTVAALRKLHSRARPAAAPASEPAPHMPAPRMPAHAGSLPVPPRAAARGGEFIRDLHPQQTAPGAAFSGIEAGGPARRDPPRPAAPLPAGSPARPPYPAPRPAAEVVSAHSEGASARGAEKLRRFARAHGLKTAGFAALAACGLIFSLQKTDARPPADMAQEMRARGSLIDAAAAREDLAAMSRHVSEMKAGIDDLGASTAAAMAELRTRIDRMDRAALAPAREAAATAGKSPAPPYFNLPMPLYVAPPQPAGGTTIAAKTSAAPPRGYVVREVYANGSAVVENAAGRRRVAIGDVLPGAGIVHAIELRDQQWVVVTAGGLIGASLN